jgi:hypothetical protein
MNHYNLLGVEISDSYEKIDDRFEEIQQQNPDFSEFLFVEQNEEVQEFEKFCEAYFVLSNPKRRLNYDKSLGIMKPEFEIIEEGLLNFSYEKYTRIILGLWFDKIKPVFENPDIQSRIRPLGEYYKSFLFDLCTTKPQTVINEISPQVNSCLINLMILNLAIGIGAPKFNFRDMLIIQIARTESIRLFVEKLNDLWKYNNEIKESQGIFNGYTMFFYIKLMDITRYCQKVMESQHEENKFIGNSSTMIPLNTDNDLQNEKISINYCQICHNFTKTQKVVIEQIIGLILLRKYKKVEGYLCSDCIEKIFWEYSSNTLFFGWWGLISFFLTPFILINNTISYISTKKLRQKNK